jgi:hypothetical protein
MDKDLKKDHQTGLLAASVAMIVVTLLATVLESPVWALGFVVILYCFAVVAYVVVYKESD